MAETANPTAIIAAPKITVQRIPMRSASQPIRMPPAPVPIQVRAAAIEVTWRIVPRSSVIGFSPTIRISGEPYDTDNSASVTPAATHAPGASTARFRSFDVAPPASGIDRRSSQMPNARILGKGV